MLLQNLHLTMNPFLMTPQHQRPPFNSIKLNPHFQISIKIHHHSQSHCEKNDHSFLNDQKVFKKASRIKLQQQIAKIGSHLTLRWICWKFQQRILHQRIKKIAEKGKDFWNGNLQMIWVMGDRILVSFLNIWNVLQRCIKLDGIKRGQNFSKL